MLSIQNAVLSAIKKHVCAVRSFVSAHAGSISIATILGLLTLGYQIYHNQKVDEQTYLKQGADHLPLFSVENCRIAGVEAHRDSIEYIRELLGFQGDVPLYGVTARLIYKPLRVEIEYSLRNRSKEPAFLGLCLYDCRRTYSYELRDMLLSDKKLPIHGECELAHDPFMPEGTEFPPDSQCVYRDPVILDRASNKDRFTIHMCQLYQNSLGNWFDLYSWLDINVNYTMDLDSILQAAIDNQQVFDLNRLDSTYVHINIAPGVRNIGQRPHIYTKRESRIVERRIRQFIGS